MRYVLGSDVFILWPELMIVEMFHFLSVLHRFDDVRAVWPLFLLFAMSCDEFEILRICEPLQSDVLYRASLGLAAQQSCTGLSSIELYHKKTRTTLGTVSASKPCSSRILVYWPEKTAFFTSSLCKFLLKSA